MKKQPEENKNKKKKTRTAKASGSDGQQMTTVLLDSVAVALVKLLLLLVVAWITLQCCPSSLAGVIKASASAASIGVDRPVAPATASVASAGANASSPSPSGRVVRTKYGNLRGFILPAITSQQSSGNNNNNHRSKATPAGSSNNNNNNNAVEAFLGIPYAAAPIGSLRYLPPASPGPWGPSIRPAISLPPACPQQMPPLSNRSASLESMPRARYYQLKRMQLMLANQSEDCLFLNIYAPSEGFSGSGSTTTPFSTSLAVVVLIHGESYSWGAGHLMDGGMLAAKSRMVVVTLNYRLGILGFLQTAASPTPGQTRGKSKHAIPTQGNYGLLDIMAALVWLKDNIGGFGGDSNRITLSGHGTGAALVNLLMISPLAAGLFQRAVLMSGSALSPWALNHQAGWLKAEVARQMDCGPPSDQQQQQQSNNKEMSLMMADIGDCLRKRPLESLMAVRLPPTPRFCTTFAPFVDGAGIVAVDPLHAMQSASQDFARIPLVAGVTSIESYRHTGDKDLREGISEDRRDRTLRTLIRNFYQFHLNEIFYVLRNEYTDWDRPSALDALSMRDSLSLALSDSLVVAPLMHVVHLHAQRSANPSGTFFYHYQGHQQQQQPPPAILAQPPMANVGQQLSSDADLSDYNRLGSVTGDELEALELDATANGAPWYNWDDDHEETSYILNIISNGNNNNTIHHHEGTAMSGSQFLPFLTAFASTGDPNLEIGSKGELIPRSKLRWEPFNLHSQYYMVFGGQQQQHAHLKTHYRGHHIAVWLQLIPQLHQPGGDPASYATASSYSNHHRFDRKNTPVEQFYEGVVRQPYHLPGTGNATTGWPSIGTGPTAFSGAMPVECSSSGNFQRVPNNFTLNATSSGIGSDWTLVNPNVMASETGNNNNTVVATAGGGNMLGFFWTNETALCITLVLGVFFLAANLILFVAIYRRRMACGRRRNGDKRHDDDGDTSLQRDVSRLEGHRATESIESMTDLRQMVASSSSSNRHCLQHGSRDNHPDITSAVIQHPPPQQYSDLAAARMSPPSPPYLLKAPPPHHQFLLDESNRRTTTSTLPGNRRSQQLTATNYHQATIKSIREITV